MEKILNDTISIIYHSKDPDGLLSAFLIENFYVKNKNYVLIPYNYEKEADWMDFETNHSRQFIFVDITPPTEWLVKALNFGYYNIMIFDHHEPKFNEIGIALDCFAEEKSFEHVFESVNKFECKSLQYYFSSVISAAKIIYEVLNTWYFNTIFKINHNELLSYNILIDFVSAYDTWAFVTFPKERKDAILAINTYLFLMKDNYPLFKEEILSNKNYLQDFKLKGDVLLAKEISDNESILRNCFEDIFGFHNCELNKYIIFEGTPTYQLQESIKKLYPDCNYIIGYKIYLNKDNSTKIKLSIRNGKVKGFLDCNELAKWLLKIDNLDNTGGGHEGSSGVTISFNLFLKLITHELFDVNSNN